MHESELVRIAAFKLHETGNRIGALAQAAESRSVRSQLLELHKKLILAEKEVVKLVDRPLASAKVRLAI